MFWPKLDAWKELGAIEDAKEAVDWRSEADCMYRFAAVLPGAEGSNGLPSYIDVVELSLVLVALKMVLSLDIRGKFPVVLDFISFL
jgi:hypothetical protein